MDRPIQRRDFLNGVAVAIGASFLGTQSASAQQQGTYYPPALTGMRGLYPVPSGSGERYDLVIVGGGISGLSAAYFYREPLAATRAF